MDHFKQVESFVSAVKLGSLSAAARAEGIQPGSIAARLDALEKRLGERLVLRSNSGVVPTFKGRAFYLQCQQLLSSLESAERTVAASNKTVRGHLRITAPTGFGRRHIAPLLPRLLASHPRLTAALDLNDQFDALVSKSFDCAIKIGDLADSSLVSVRLAETHRVVVGAPSYLATHGAPRHPSDLAAHNCLCFNSGGGHNPCWQFRIGKNKVDQPVSGSLACTDGAVVYRWVLAGHGLAWRSTWEVKASLERGELVSVLDEFAASSDGIFAVFPRRQHLAARVTTFVDFLRASYRLPGYPAESVTEL